MAEDIKDGLEVRRRPGQGWAVVHVSSALNAGPCVHYKADALSLRVLLLGTGLDWTQEVRQLSRGGDRAAFTEAARIAARFTARCRPGTSGRVTGPRMIYIAHRNTDRLIHITNVLGGLTGQHHVHDDKSLAAWMEGRPKVGIGPVSSSDIEWHGDGQDCTCGQEIWRRPT